MNVFEAVKQSVTTRQAAEHFGIRVGRNGMCVCPFHAMHNLHCTEKDIIVIILCFTEKGNQKIKFPWKNRKKDQKMHNLLLHLKKLSDRISLL